MVLHRRECKVVLCNPIPGIGPIPTFRSAYTLCPTHSSQTSGSAKHLITLNQYIEYMTLERRHADVNEVVFFAFCGIKWKKYLASIPPPVKISMLDKEQIISNNPFITESTDLSAGILSLWMDHFISSFSVGL